MHFLDTNLGLTSLLNIVQGKYEDKNCTLFILESNEDLVLSTAIFIMKQHNKCGRDQKEYVYFKEPILLELEEA